MKNHVFTTDHPRKTKEFAKTLSSYLHSGDVLGLRGELGSGKTTFVQGLGAGLKIHPGYKVKSPTFTLVNEYPYRKGKGFLYHIDFYRLKNKEEVNTLGLDQYFNENSICVIEWFEKASNVLPLDFLEIKFLWVSESSRTITMIPHGPRSQKVLQNFS